MKGISLRRCLPVGRVVLLIGSTIAAVLGGNSIQAQTAPEVWQVSGIAMGSSIAPLPTPIFGVIMPEVVAWPDGTYRMYYSAIRDDGGVDIWYADSPDAITFAVRGMVLAGTSDPCDPEFTVAGASLVHLPDGRWRMYYQARQSGPPSPPNCAQIQFQTYSAISADGVTFTREGVRFAARSQDRTSPYGGVAHSRFIELDDGTYAGFLTAYLAPPDNRMGIFLATSSDGLNFGTPEAFLVPSGHDPYVVKVGRGYVLYADILPEGASSIPMLTSTDGINWSAPSTASFVDASGAPMTFGTLGPDGIGDVGGVVLRDGTLHLYTDWTGIASDFLSYRLAGSEPPPNANYQGLWWNAPAGSESGWGINFAHQGTVIFATWFTYSFAGRSWWLSMTANRSGVVDNLYSGSLHLTNGPVFDATPFDPAQVTGMDVGSGTLYFSDANNGTFTYQMGGFTQIKQITRQVFGPLPICATATASLAAAINYTDLWWAAPAGSESGWGINFSHQGNTIFATWFTYDANHMPLWLSATAVQTEPNTYMGTLYLTNGPAFNSVPFDPTQVIRKDVGTARLTFTDGNIGTFAYHVEDLAGGIDKANQAKAIIRQVFRAPGTVCQ